MWRRNSWADSFFVAQKGPDVVFEKRDQTAIRQEAKIFATRLAIAVLCIKFVFLLIDPHMRLFMGDSGTYLASAVHQRAPGDRSFTYPLFIGLTAGTSGSIVTLTLLQTLCGVGTTLLTCWILRGFFNVRRWVIVFTAILLAADPGQLFYERMVMTESTSTFVLIAALATALAYLRNGNLVLLLACVLLGIALSSLRSALVPVALLLPVAAVLLRFPQDVAARRLWLVHLAVALVAIFGGHTAYKHWYGARSGGGPGYIRDAGIFRLGLVAPLVKPAHFAGTGVDPSILDEVKIPLSDPYKREAQIWLPGGLIDVIRQHANGRTRAIANTVANRAIADDPIGLLRLGLHTELEYFNHEKRRVRMWSDLGSGQPPDEHTIELLSRHFHYDASTIARTPSVVWLYFEHSAIWLTLCHFALAPLAIFMLVLHRDRQQKSVWLLALLCIGFVVGHVICSHIISFRYLHPFSVLAVVCGAIVADIMLSVWRRSPIAALLASDHNYGQLQPAPSL